MNAITVPIPDNESNRQLAVERLNSVKEHFARTADRVVELLYDFTTPAIALLTVIDRDQWRAISRYGEIVATLAREESFCVWTIASSDVLIIDDMLKDERFKYHPLVRGTSSMRFYAGIPIRDPEGLTIATLCIVDRKKRIFDSVLNRTFINMRNVLEENYRLLIATSH